MSIEYAPPFSLKFTCTVTAEHILCHGSSMLPMGLLLSEIGAAFLYSTYASAGSSAGVYLHLLEGRIRIRSAVIKGNPQRARLLAQQLQTHAGITQVFTNTLTGSVLVFYDSEQVPQEQVLVLLATVGQLPELMPLCLPIMATARSPVPTQFGQQMLHAVIRTCWDTAVQRLVLALL